MRAPRRGDFTGDSGNSAFAEPDLDFQATCNIDTKFDVQQNQN